MVARPIGSFKGSSDYHFQTLRCNVDLLRIIQLGLTLTDERGETPPTGVCTWQFNFAFSVTYAPFFTTRDAHCIKLRGHMHVTGCTCTATTCTRPSRSSS